MTLSFKEKKDLATNLIEQGISTREIAKQTHLSLTTIGKIRKELEGDTSEKSTKPLSISSQSFKLFEKHKSLVQVAIKLDLSREEVTKFHCDYLILKDRQNVNYILKENTDKINEILKVSDFLKTNKIDINDLENNIDLTNRVHKLKSEYDIMELAYFNLNESNKYLSWENERLKNKYKSLNRFCN